MVCLCLNAGLGKASEGKAQLGLACFEVMCQVPAECDICDVTAFASPPLPPPSFFPVILESTSHDCLYVSSTIFTALVPPPRNHAAPAHPLTAFTYVGVRRLPPNHEWKKASCLRGRAEDWCSRCQLGNTERHFQDMGLQSSSTTWWVIGLCRQWHHVSWYVRRISNWLKRRKISFKLILQICIKVRHDSVR